MCNLNSFMNKIICVSGDSFTQEIWQSDQYKWSTLIGASHNIALGGSSNQRIFEKTIEYLNQNQPDILIVGWSATERATLHLSDGKRLVVTPNRIWDEETQQEHDKVGEFYYKHLHNRFVNFKATLEQMVFLQEYCKLKKIKLRYFRSVMRETVDDDCLKDISKEAFLNRSTAHLEMQGIEHNLNLLKNLVSKLDPNIWIKSFWFSMWDVVSKYDLKNYGANKTPLPKDAVQEWARIVKESL